MGKVKMRAPIRAAIEDEWQRRATAAAIESARKLIGVDGTIKPGTPVGKLSDYELGWIISSGICAWISKRAEQATAEGFSLSVIEEAIRDTGTAPQPWDAGAVATILPKLADAPGIDWSLPLDEWPREMMLTFLCAGFDHVLSLGRTFIPTLDEINVDLASVRIPSISMEQSKKLDFRVERALLSLPEVDLVFSKAGTANLIFDAMGSNESDLVR
jgi:hypothetical protein